MPENGSSTRSESGGIKRGGEQERRFDAKEALVRRLVRELREGGVAHAGLGFALAALGAESVERALADREPFGREARRRAARSEDEERRAAWIVLAACEPRVVRRRLEAGGIARRPERRPTVRRRVPDRRDRLRPADCCASFGRGAPRTPFQEQLAEVAERLFGGAVAA